MKGQAATKAGRMNQFSRKAREINDQPWEPLPGMHKVRCAWCEFWFSAPHSGNEQVCPICIERQRHAERATVEEGE